MVFLLSACWIRGLIFLFSVRGELLFRELTKDMEGVSEFKASSIGGFGRNDEEAVLWNIGDFVLSDKKDRKSVV